MKQKVLNPEPAKRSYPRQTRCGCSGVSEVVGEMLMIVLVIILISVFSAAIYNYLPADRDPTITVMKTNDRQNLTLWHKGGDWVKTEDLTVVIGNETNRTSYSRKDLVLVPDKPVFDLNSSITVRAQQQFEGNETVRLVTSHSVIYTGRISL